MFARFLLATLIYFPVEILPYSDTFLGNSTLNLTGLAMISERPKLMVTFHEKVDGKAGASERGKIRKDNKMMLMRGLNRFRRSERLEDSSGHEHHAITLPDEKVETVYDPVKVKIPTTQTIEYYGFVPFSAKTRSGTKSVPLVKTDSAISKDFTSMPDSVELTSYGHSSMFSVDETEETFVLSSFTIRGSYYSLSDPAKGKNLTNSELEILAKL